MPLRVLLLLPDGEQPSIPRTTGHKSIAKPLKSPTNRSFKTPSSPLSGVPSRLSNDYRSKPLPSPPPFNVNVANRASNQTHLTLPSTSGSSAGSSSRSTEYVPSPPLSPDPTTVSFASPTADSFADVTVRGLKLNPNKSSSHVKPVLRLNTKLPRTGKGLRYISSSTGDHSGSEEEEDEGEDDQDGVYSVEMEMHASTSRTNDDGAATARKAVDDRLQHLLAITAETLSLHRISHMTRNSNIPSSPLPHSPLDKPLPQHLALHPSIPPNTPSKTHFGPSRRKQYRKRPLRNSKPPPAPTRALPPYKIFGPHDAVPLDIINDPRRARKIPIRSGGWGRTGVLIQSTRSQKPKGAKGKYIRLVTLPPLPPAKVSKVDAWDEDLDALDIISFTRDSGRRKGKGRMPTILVDNEEDSGGNMDGKSSAPRREKEVSTVYMTELVSNQWARPVPCMMWPPPLPTPSSSASRSSSRPTSYTSTRPTSTLSRLSTSTSFGNATSPSPSTLTQGQILTPQTSTYQLPLPTLTPLQKTSLHAAGILVYAVPKSYTGSVPPPECARLGEELAVREEEVAVVGPWATAQIPTLHSLQTSGEVGNGGGSSQRGSTLGFTSPARSPLSVNIFTANGGGAGGGGVLSASLSPRWPTEGLGLWSRSKSGGSKRGSAASAMSGVESPSPVHSRPASGVMQNVVEEKHEDGAQENATTITTTTSAGGWSSSFSSIRARAQGYYAKDGSTTPTPAIPSLDAALSTSKSEILSTEASSLPMSRGTGNAIGTSRSFGSLFLRTTSSSSTNPGTSSENAASSSGVTLSTTGLTVPDSGYASSPGTGGGDVLFDYVEPPRDGEVVKVEIVETEGGAGNGSGNALNKTGWKLGGWGARWGS